MKATIFGSTIEIDESVIAESSTEIREQVREYERGGRREFDLTVTRPSGTTGEVMTALTDIPYGETRTYGEIGGRLDLAPIEMGRACANNPVPLVVPCHRVVGSGGGLRGYSAANGIVTKRRLLDLEARERETKAVQTRLSTRR